MSFQFSADGKYFAQLSCDGKLKIWDTTTSKFEQEFTPDFHLTTPCTCLHFINPSNTYNTNGSPRKKMKKRSSYTADLTSSIALGTSSGLLMVYSIVKADVHFNIDSNTSQAINCLSISDGTVYSGSDHSVLCWDLQKKSIKSKWKTGNEKITSILKIPGSEHLLTGSKNIKLWDVEEQTLLKTFIGHSSDVNVLKYVDVDVNNTYVLSGAKNDRLLSCWNLADDSKLAAAHFTLDDFVADVSLIVEADKTTKIAAVTKSGACNLFIHTLNGHGGKPVKPKVILKIASDASQGEQVRPLPIISTMIKENLSLTIVHGIEIKLTFETIAININEKMQFLVREDPLVMKSVNQGDVTKMKIPIIENASYVSSSVTKRKVGGTVEVPMEKRLENLALNKLEGIKGVPKANNMAQLLLQGLKSKDRKIMLCVFSNRDETFVSNTVKRLPINVVFQLVDELSALIQGKTFNCEIGAIWLKHVLKVHAGILVSNPDLPTILGPIAASINNRLNLHNPLAKLSGRLDLLVSQLSTSSGNEEQEEHEALMIYNDRESDSEDDIEIGAHSESENEWNEESSSDEDIEIDKNGDVISDEEMST